MSFEDIHIGIPARFLREVKKYGQEELWILLHAFLVRAEGKTYLLKGEINEKFNVGVDRTEFALRKLAADGWFVEDGPGIWKMLNGQVEHQTQTELVQVVPATAPMGLTLSTVWGQAIWGSSLETSISTTRS